MSKIYKSHVLMYENCEFMYIMKAACLQLIYMNIYVH